MPATEGQPDRVWSAGLVAPRSRFAFSLGMGAPADPLRGTGWHEVPGVDGSAMMLRRDAVRAAAIPPGEVFPESFFAYSEEVDLALRLARRGHRAGMCSDALARHRARGSGGFRQTTIRARFLRNHWLVSLRNESWGRLLRDLPWWVRGELQFWLPEYLSHPLAFVRALADLPGALPAARRFFAASEAQWGPTGDRAAEWRRAGAKTLQQPEFKQ